QQELSNLISTYVIHLYRTIFLQNGTRWL
ncbi:unnamed protein product, partial [Allacma fusca]